MNRSGIRLPHGVPYASASPRTPSTTPAAAAASAVITDSGESYAQQVPWPDGQELTVATMTRRWRACDVYVAPLVNVPATLVITVRIYALLAGARVLVASGRLGNWSTDPLTVAVPQALRPAWVAAARSQATKWEVTLFASTPPAGAQIAVWAVASDEADDVPEGIGEIAVGLNGHIVSAADTGTSLPDAELRWVSAVVNEAIATPRFLMIFDTSNIVLPGAGEPPLFCFPLGVGTAGGGAARIDINRRTNLGLFMIMTSSTFGLWTPSPGDCRIQAVIR